MDVRFVSEKRGAEGTGVDSEGTGRRKMTNETRLQVVAKAVKPIGDYLALKAAIKAMDAQAEELRETIVHALAADGAPAGTTWEVPGVATVTVVSGRVSEKLDRARLAKAGVAADVLDAATVRTEGKPSMRITAADVEADREQ